MIQSGTRGLGFILANVTVEVGGSGFNLTIGGGSNDPPMPRGRNAVYHFVCDTTVPESNGPDETYVRVDFFTVNTAEVYFFYLITDTLLFESEAA